VSDRQWATLVAQRGRIDLIDVIGFIGRAGRPDRALVAPRGSRGPGPAAGS
jgi:hypothetical protein